jgi:GH15 family glucan-1,4-alpha-glucosidase
MSGRIEDYALLGDLHTAALVGRDGSIDWLCLPRFDSPACFAALLGEEENGHWLVAPAAGGTCTRRQYRGDTLVLETFWQTADGLVRVVDCMPPRAESTDVVRIVEGISGTVPMPGRTPRGCPPRRRWPGGTSPPTRSSACPRASGCRSC